MKGFSCWVIILLAACASGQQPDPNNLVYSGKVADFAGEGVGEAKIDVYDALPSVGLPHQMRYVGSITSDADGSYNFSRPRRGIGRVNYGFAVFSADGYALAWTCFSMMGNKIREIPLEVETLSFSGKVIDTSNKPIADATVYAILEHDRHRSMDQYGAGVSQFTRVTDDEGNFTFAMLPRGTEGRFCAVKEGYAWSYTFRTDKPLSFDNNYRSKRKKEDTTLVLQREVSLSGELVLNETGAGLEGEKLSIVRNQGEGTRLYRKNVISKTLSVQKTLSGRDNLTITTGPEGKFLLEHLHPGTYTLFHHNLDCVEKGLFSKKYRVVLEEGIDRDIKVSVFSGQAFQLKGELSESGSALGNVRISLRRRYDKGETKFHCFDYANVSSNTEGKFHFNIPPGNYKISCYADSYELVQKDQTVTFPSDSGKVLHFVGKQKEEAGVITGTCVDAGQKPLEGVEVFLTSDPENRVVTDRAGNFQFTPRLDKCRGSVMPVLARRQREWDDPGRMSVDIANNPQLLRLIEKQRSSDDSWMVIDTFLVARTADMKQQAIRHYYSHNFLKNPVTPQKLILRPACTLTGRVLDENKRPIPNASVTVDLAEHAYDLEPLYSYLKVMTDSEGKFRCSVLADKTKYYYGITAEGEDGRVLRKCLSNNHTTDSFRTISVINYKTDTVDCGDFVLSPPTEKVSGVVVDYLGRAVCNATVTLTSREQGVDGMSLETAEDGRFEFTDLCLTRVRLVAEYDKYASYTTMAGEEDIRLILFGSEIPEEDLTEKCVPSAAVELTIIDKITGKPVKTKGLSISLEEIDGPNYRLDDPGEDGKQWMFVGQGDYVLKLYPQRDTYKHYKMSFHAEINEVYHFTVELEPTAKFQSLRSKTKP